MSVDELLIGATKAKLNEVVQILEKENFTKSHILEIIEKSSNEFIEQLKNELWAESLEKGYRETEEV